MDVSASMMTSMYTKECGFWDWAAPCVINRDLTNTRNGRKKESAKLWFKLLRRKGFDILVTHAPAYQLNDGRDLPHQGFRSFIKLMEKYKPRIFLHGHVHLSYGRGHKRYDKYQDTHVINAYERCIFDYEDEHLEEHVH